MASAKKMERQTDMDTFDNGLTDAQEERLKMLAEEAGEIVQCCMKILRHGYNSVGYNNKSDLERELKELWTIYERMAYYSELGRLNFHDVGDVWKNKLPFTHYQPETIPVNHPPDVPSERAKLNNAARAGWDDFLAGLPNTACPFPTIRTDLHRDWRVGWDAASAHGAVRTRR